MTSPAQSLRSALGCDLIFALFGASPFDGQAAIVKGHSTRWEAPFRALEGSLERSAWP